MPHENVERIDEDEHFSDNLEDDEGSFSQTQLTKKDKKYLKRLEKEKVISHPKHGGVYDHSNRQTTFTQTSEDGENTAADMGDIAALYSDDVEPEKKAKPEDEEALGVAWKRELITWLSESNAPIETIEFRTDDLEGEIVNHYKLFPKSYLSDAEKEFQRIGLMQEHRNIIRLLITTNMSNKDIADKLDIKTNQVSQVKTRTLEKLRKLAPPRVSAQRFVWSTLIMCLSKGKVGDAFQQAASEVGPPRKGAKPKEREPHQQLEEEEPKRVTKKPQTKGLVDGVSRGETEIY